MAERTPLSPEQVTELTELSDDIAATARGTDVARRFEYVVDALIMREQLPESFKRVIAKIKPDADAPLVRLAAATDKYAAISPDIPCLELLPLCKGRCCSFDVVLSAQDVAEKIVPFEIERPYMLPRDPETRRCACMDDAGQCTVYEARPYTCRVYDCRGDRRVWLDYEARIPAPWPPR